MDRRVPDRAAGPPARAETLSTSATTFTASDLDRVRAVIEAFRRINHSLDLDVTLNAILDGVRSLIDYDAAGIYVVDPETGRLRTRVLRGYTLRRPAREHALEEGILGRVFASQQPLLVSDVAADPGHVEGRESARTEIVAPVVGSRGLVGLLNLESDRQEAYSTLSLDLLALFASGVAGNIESALLYADIMAGRRLEAELQVARRVMEELLPRHTPALEGFEIAGMNEPSYEVGGDYYEFIPLGEDRWGIAIADVVGKGVAAALLVAAARASLSSLVGHELALRAILRKANRFFYESIEAGKFVTLFYAVLDVRARRLIYVNAGHLPPVLLRADGRVELLEEGGVPLGLFEEPRYQEGFARLESGDLLALYTDGISEALEAGELPDGVQRLTALLRRIRDASAEEICRSVLAEVSRPRPGRPADDRTLVVLKVR